MYDTDKFLKQIEKSVATRGLFARAETILVAVSGGLDSMVLLDVLRRLARCHGWRLTVAHFNHQLRGRSSDADERLVKHTAKKIDLPFVAGRADVRSHARKRKLSIEMAARTLRHGFLARTAARRGIGTIALAHHADDQVELFFVRLLRGSGGEGLAGMKWRGPSPVDDCIALVRPLLDQPKKALANYARLLGVKFREDATNALPDMQRNRIRGELLPLLKKNYQPALERLILRQMEIAGTEADFVTMVAMKWLSGGKRISFEKLPMALKRRCLQLQLSCFGFIPNFDLIEKLRECANTPVTLNAHVRVSRNTEGILTVQQSGITPLFHKVIKVRLQGRTGEIQTDTSKITWKKQLAARGIFRAPKREVNRESFDASKIGNDIQLRRWRAGDRFQPIGMKKPVKLQNLFTNEKIPRTNRHHLGVATTAAGEIFWVEGLRMGERFKLSKNSRYELKWAWKRL